MDNELLDSSIIISIICVHATIRCLLTHLRAWMKIVQANPTRLSRLIVIVGILITRENENENV